MDVKNRNEVQSNAPDENDFSVILELSRDEKKELLKIWKSRSHISG